MSSNPFRWPVQWRRRTERQDGEDLIADEVIFWTLDDFVASVPRDLFDYCPKGYWSNPEWFGRDFQFPWEPLDHITRPDMRALRNYVEPMRRALTESIPLPYRKRRRSAWADDGNEVDIDRAKAGRPCFRNLGHVMQVGHATIGLLVDLGISADVKGADLYWRGAVALALCDRLESQGYSVEVWAVDRAFPQTRVKAISEACANIFVRLKAAGESLEVSGLVNMLSWMPRVIMYPLVSTAPCLRDTVKRDLSPTTRSWLWVDDWQLAGINAPKQSYILYGFDSGEMSRKAIRAILNDIERTGSECQTTR
jgi:hypothetical protein